MSTSDNSGSTCSGLARVPSRAKLPSWALGPEPELEAKLLPQQELAPVQAKSGSFAAADPGQEAPAYGTNQGSKLTGAVTSPAVAEPIFFDLETRSACDLKKYGGRLYARHPSTGILSVAAVIDTEIVMWFPLLTIAPSADAMRPVGCPQELRVTTYVGKDLPAPLRAAIAAGRVLCGHNAFDFDRPVWQVQGWPEPAGWLDTLHEARAACMPGKLELLGRRLLGYGKDKEGERILKLYMKPNNRGHFRPLTQEAATAIGRYNVKDVLICREVYQRYHDCIEPDVLALDQTINARGISFDTELAQGLIRVSTECTRRTIQEMEQATGGVLKGSDLRRDKFLLKWLRDRRLGLPDLQRETVENQLDGQDISPEIRAVLQARMAAMRKSTNKLETGLLHVDEDGRLRHLLVYHQAHTGRWAGRGVQPQNLPRPHKKLGDVTGLIPAVGSLATLMALLPDGVTVDDAIAALVRPCFQAASGKSLVTVDFSAIEARGLAWCAGDESLIAQFARGDDVYSQFASGLFGRQVTKRDERERAIGKVAVLACGYSMGADRFAEKCRKDKVDLETVGLTAKQVIDGYRDAYPAIAGQKGQYGDYRTGGLWKDLEYAARTAIETGQPQVVAHCRLERVGNDLVVRLPSGRRMFFRDARVEMAVPAYAARLGLPPNPKPTIYYTDSRNQEESLYGGKLAENIVSGICRDLQVAAMLGIEAAGLPIVLHVHDENVVEVDEAAAEAALKTMLQTMSMPPSWAAGVPVQAEGFVSPRYVKSAPAGVTSRSARNGRLLES